MNSKVYLASFYYLYNNIGWSIVEKEDGVYKSGSIDKDEFTSFLDSNEEDFEMCDYVVFNEVSKLLEKQIRLWFITKTGLTIFEKFNGYNIKEESELQAYNFFKEYKDNNLDRIRNYIKISKS